MKKSFLSIVLSSIIALSSCTLDPLKTLSNHENASLGQIKGNKVAVEVEFDKSTESIVLTSSKGEIKTLYSSETVQFLNDEDITLLVKTKKYGEKDYGIESKQEIKKGTFSIKAIVQYGTVYFNVDVSKLQKELQAKYDKAEKDALLNIKPSSAVLAGGSSGTKDVVLTASASTLYSSAPVTENIDVSNYELKTGSVGIKNYKDYRFKAQSNKLYTIFLSTTSGDADIYGKISTDSLELKPQTTKVDNGSYGSVYDLETGINIPLKSNNSGNTLDTIKFKPSQTQDILLRVTSVTGDSSYKLRIEEGEYINGFLVKGSVRTRYLLKNSEIGLPISEETTTESQFSDLKARVQFFENGSIWSYYEGYLKDKVIFVPKKFTDVVKKMTNYNEYESQIKEESFLLGLPVSDEIPQKSQIYGDGTKVEFEEGYCRIPENSLYVDSLDHMLTGTRLFEIYLYEMGNSSDELNEPIFAVYNTYQYGLVFDTPWDSWKTSKEMASFFGEIVYDVTLKDFADVSNPNLSLFDRLLSLGSIGLTIESFGILEIGKAETTFVKVVSKIPSQLTRGILRESNIILKASKLLEGISIVSKNTGIEKLTIKIEKAGQIINKEVKFIIDIVRPTKVIEIKDVKKLYLSNQLQASIDFYKGKKEFILLVTENNERISTPLAKKIYEAGGNIYRLDSNNNIISKYYFKGNNVFQWGNVNNFSLVDILK